MDGVLETARNQGIVAYKGDGLTPRRNFMTTITLLQENVRDSDENTCTLLRAAAAPHCGHGSFLVSHTCPLYFQTRLARFSASPSGGGSKVAAPHVSRRAALSFAGASAQA